MSIKNRHGCRPCGDVCMEHDEPLWCRHGCSEAAPHVCRERTAPEWRCPCCSQPAGKCHRMPAFRKDDFDWKTTPGVGRARIQIHGMTFRVYAVRVERGADGTLKGIDGLSDVMLDDLRETFGPSRFKTVLADGFEFVVAMVAEEEQQPDARP